MPQYEPMDGWYSGKAMLRPIMASISARIVGASVAGFSVGPSAFGKWSSSAAASSKKLFEKLTVRQADRVSFGYA